MWKFLDIEEKTLQTAIHSNVMLGRRLSVLQCKELTGYGIEARALAKIPFRPEVDPKLCWFQAISNTYFEAKFFSYWVREVGEGSKITKRSVEVLEYGDETMSAKS